MGGSHLKVVYLGHFWKDLKRKWREILLVQCEKERGEDILKNNVYNGENQIEGNWKMERAQNQQQQLIK